MEGDTGPGLISVSEFLEDVNAQHTESDIKTEPGRPLTRKRQKELMNSPEKDSKSLKQQTSVRKSERSSGAKNKDISDRDAKPGPDEMVPPPLVKRQRNKDKKGQSTKKTVPSPVQIAAAKSIASSSDAGDNVSPTSRTKELKSVNIVPVRKGRRRSAVDMETSLTPTPPPRRSKRNISSTSKDLDLSIRSSMFGSPSDSSFI